MNLRESILYKLSNNWSSQFKNRPDYGDPSSEDYGYNYALHSQYLRTVKSPINFDFYGKHILEIGCGHGGISCFYAVNGAENVVGIDFNKRNLKTADNFAKKLENYVGAKSRKDLPVQFMEMDASKLDFDDGSFDIVLADNAFEHFMEPEKVMKEASRVLKKGGQLIVPIFSSWWSKNGLHLKHGIKVPWANLFLSEKSILNVLYRKAETDPDLIDFYPGIKNKPDFIREVRKYKDLNYITYGAFKKMARRQNFTISEFSVLGTRNLRFISRILRRIPIINKTRLIDIFSTGASAILTKK